MGLPFDLQNAIEKQLSSLSLKQLIVAANDLSENYRSIEHPTEKFIRSEAHRLAYLAVRAPATFAASRAALAEMRRLTPEIKIRSLLDLGAGPGASAWAAAEIFDDLEQITLIEQDEGLIKLGRELASESNRQALKQAQWQRLDLKTSTSFPTHDLILCSYSLGELSRQNRVNVLQTAWQSVNQVLVMIEPGTKKGFGLIRLARDLLIETGGCLIAPCPDHQACPMTGPTSGEDWCHFSQRFERSAIHRKIKAGALGYEDEKYSYLAVSKNPIKPAAARIIRHPLRFPGYTKIKLCRDGQIEEVTATRRDKEKWRRARKADWGDGWD